MNVYNLLPVALGLAAMSIGCGFEVDKHRTAEPALEVHQTLSQPNIKRVFLPFSLEDVTRESQYRMSESHGVKGGGHFWSFHSSDERTGIDVEGVDQSHLTKITFYVAHSEPAINVAADLDVMQFHVQRILPDESWTKEKGLGFSSEVQSLPSIRVDGKFELKLLHRNVDTVLEISPSQQNP